MAIPFPLRNSFTIDAVSLGQYSVAIWTALDRIYDESQIWGRFDLMSYGNTGRSLVFTLSPDDASRFVPASLALPIDQIQLSLSDLNLAVEPGQSTSFSTTGVLFSDTLVRIIAHEMSHAVGTVDPFDDNSLENLTNYLVALYRHPGTSISELLRRNGDSHLFSMTCCA